MARRLVVLATPVVLLAGGWVIFYVLEEPPVIEQCSLGEAPGVADYRRGLGTYATFSAAVIGALIARTSPTKRTLYALAACAWLAALYNLENDTLVPHALVALALMVFGGELLLLSSAIAIFAMRRPRIAELTYLWTALLLVLPAAVGFPASEGVPFVCL